MEEALRGVGPQPNVSGVPPIRWYSRTALDEFLAAAEKEQARLEATIADAQMRLARANSAVGLHQTMVEMILEVQREVAEIRRAAELASAEIIAAGELEAQAVLRGAAEAQPRRTVADGAVTADGRVPVGGNHPSIVGVGTATAPGDDDEAFFSYLKHELDKDEPLGPWQS